MNESERETEAILRDEEIMDALRRVKEERGQSFTLEEVEFMLGIGKGYAALAGKLLGGRMSDVLRVVELLREHRARLNYDRKLAAGMAGEDSEGWVYDALDMHVQMVDEVLSVLVPGKGANRGEE